MRHRRAAVRHGRCTLRSIEVRLSRSIDAGGSGSHAGAVGFAGVLTAGELRRPRAGPRRLPCFCVYDTWARLTGGSLLSVTVQS